MAPKRPTRRRAKGSPSRHTRSGQATAAESAGALSLFHPITAEWFRTAFAQPTLAQQLGWPAIARGESTLILAPTGTGKTLAAFLWCLNRLMFELPASGEAGERGCRVIYVSPLKALAVDVERNLRAPLKGLEETARRSGISAREPAISIRTGDTPQKERSRFRRHPAEILITTPESLYLMLTSAAAESLRQVDTVILDEIHSLVPNKRGAHLALSLERLEALAGRRLQRIGLSATQRPLEEVARFLGGVEAATPEEGAPNFRPVTIVQAAEPKALKLRVEVPVEDMARIGRSTAAIAAGAGRNGQQAPPPNSPEPAGPKQTSIWNAMYPRLVEIVRERRSTIIFVNSRRIAERMAAALNELAGEPLARAHHGSLAAGQRAAIEEQLKAGNLRALVATSSLELGIDMGAVDLVVQVEAPPSVASAIQRIGRAGHSAGAVSEGVLFPKYRADLVACAAVTRAMHEGHVESTRYLRNPLDILAQQVVAIAAQPPAAVRTSLRALPASLEQSGIEIGVDALFRLVRGAAPFAELTRQSFYGVLDSLSGFYPSEEFAELRPRITWDRERNTLWARQGAKMLAILNGGSIPDRGLYGVFLSGTTGKPVRVGELDEEMVYESRNGDIFNLGASAWRIDEILRDRVMVSPAPGQAGKAPFWHGDAAGRPLEFGRRIGQLVRELREMPPAAALSRLMREHDMDAQAAENLIRFLSDQAFATSAVPDDRTLVIERTRDELGDWRMCVLSPLGSRIHAPWALAVGARVQAAGGPEVEVLWGDDGFIVRFPDSDAPPGPEHVLIPPAEATELVLHQLSGSALFAAKFRESAARALLLPRRRATGRTPLWQQRQRAYDLLSVAARYPSFPILLETYRECMRDVFDMPALLETLTAIDNGSLRVHVAETPKPSPYASSLFFRYLINHIYDGDAPLAERRAQALSIDQDQLQDLLGEADLRELLDPAAIASVEEQLQLLSENLRARSADGIHDLLLRLGDLSRGELRRRLASPDLIKHLNSLLNPLLRARRVVEIEIAGEKRLIAAEDGARYRDALSLRLPAGIPSALLAPVTDAALGLIRRFARTHGPFTVEEAALRFALDPRRVETLLRTLTENGRIVEGGFRPNGLSREWCDAEVLRLIRQRSLARLRHEIEPAEPQALARMETHWQGVVHRRRGLDALLDAVEQLQGAPLPASLLETAILPARLSDYSPDQLDTLIAAGEIVWCGLDSLGERDGRIALALSDKLVSLLPPSPGKEVALPPREALLLEILNRNGAAFFNPLHEAAGGGYPGETLDALWNLVWLGLITNDTFHALRAYIARPVSTRQSKRQHNQPPFRSRRTIPPSAQGRWVALPSARLSATEWSHATAHRMLARYGVLTREAAAQENLPGGFSAVYDVLKALEERGSIRRGYFAAGLGAAQFAVPAAVDLLRGLRSGGAPETPEMISLAAADPANLYGAVLRWPEGGSSETAGEPAAPDSAAPDSAAPGSAGQLSRSAGATVVLRNGALLAYLRHKNPHLQIFLPAEEPERSQHARDLAAFLAAMSREETRRGEDGRGGLLISTISGRSAASHFFASFLKETGFRLGPKGFHLPRSIAQEASGTA
jgi:ATP-dependent Lhr-like helicase